jgi:hypothetical protein
VFYIPLAGLDMYRWRSRIHKNTSKRSEESFSFAILRADRDRQKQEIMKHDDGLLRWRAINEMLFFFFKFNSGYLKITLHTWRADFRQFIKLSK